MTAPTDLDPHKVDLVMTLICLALIAAAVGLGAWRIASAPTNRPPLGEVTPATCCPPVPYLEETP